MMENKSHDDKSNDDKLIIYEINQLYQSDDNNMINIANQINEAANSALKNCKNESNSNFNIFAEVEKRALINENNFYLEKIEYLKKLKEQMNEKIKKKNLMNEIKNKRKEEETSGLNLSDLEEEELSDLKEEEISGIKHNEEETSGIKQLSSEKEEDISELKEDVLRTLDLFSKKHNLYEIKSEEKYNRNKEYNRNTNHDVNMIIPDHIQRQIRKYYNQ